VIAKFHAHSHWFQTFRTSCTTVMKWPAKNKYWKRNVTIVWRHISSFYTWLYLVRSPRNRTRQRGSKDTGETEGLHVVISDWNSWTRFMFTLYGRLSDVGFLLTSITCWRSLTYTPSVSTISMTTRSI
jgi:hypothetical protein